MDLKILSFTGKKIHKTNVISIILTTKSGEINILDNHSSLISSIKPSTMYYIYLDENNVKIRDDLAIGNGFVEVSNNNIKIILDMLVDIEDLDLNILEKAKDNALSLMSKYKNAKDKIDMEKFIEAEDSLLKSIAQLKLYDIKK